MRKRGLLWGAIFLVSLANCRSDDRGSSSAENEIVVSAAASLKESFGEIGKLYEQRTKTRVSFNFAASGALQRQIESGAPADVFASASGREMEALAARDLIVQETRRDFARNALVLITPADSALNLDSFDDLIDSRVKRIAVGNPKTVPVGEYARQAFENAKLSSRLEGRLVYGEDVRQVLDYVARGEADVGIVYVTDARAAGNRVKVAARVDENLHEPISYPIAALRDGRGREAARLFVELVTSADAQAILRRDGFEAAR